MSTYGSMQYTVGTALDRAREEGHSVEVLVEGTWLGGLVVAMDGQGVVLENDGYEHAIVRLERISAVRVNAAAPTRRKIREHQPAGADSIFDPRLPDGAMPMPAPRVPSA